MRFTTSGAGSRNESWHASVCSGVCVCVCAPHGILPSHPTPPPPLSLLPVTGPRLAGPCPPDDGVHVGPTPPLSPTPPSPLSPAPAWDVSLLPVAGPRLAGPCPPDDGVHVVGPNRLGVRPQQEGDPRRRQRPGDVSAAGAARRGDAHAPHRRSKSRSRPTPPVLSTPPPYCADRAPRLTNTITRPAQRSYGAVENDERAWILFSEFEASEVFEFSKLALKMLEFFNVDLFSSCWYLYA